MSAGWFCINTNPRGEDLAIQHLARMGFTVLFPQYAHPTSRRLHPLFPNYLFVQFDPDIANWRPICGTPGVKRLFLITQNKPLRIPQHVIDVINLQIEKAHAIAAAPQPKIAVDDAVRVSDKESPFYSFEGICQRRSTERIDVLLSIFGRLCSVEIDAEKIEKI